MNGSFYEQLGGVAGLFDQWGACERTVVACALARRVPWPGLRLLQRAVEEALRHHVADERLERDANDEHYIAGLLAPRPAEDDDDGDKRLHKLLTLLPLLRTDNVRAKEAWVGGAGALVQRCVDAPRRVPPAPPTAPARRAELCRQLLQYLLVHPALTHTDHSTLTQWLRYLENHISGNRTTESVWQQRIEPSLLSDTNIWSSNVPFRRTIGKNMFRSVIDGPDHYTPDPLQESFSKNGRDVDISIETDRITFEAAISQPKSQRSNSLTPPSGESMQMSSSAENLSDEPLVQKPRSFSLSSEHSLRRLRPLGALGGTSGSETRLDELRAHRLSEPGGAVAHWLKSLRLHKYVWLFTNITYDQMMAIDEEYLEKLGVTKGARHKILLSIKKLSERSAVLESLESELRSSGPAPSPVALLRALERLRGVLLSPMPPASDLPPTIVRLLQLASSWLEGAAGARAPPPDDEPTPLALHCWLVEKALHHEAFRRAELREALVALRHRLPPRQFYRHVGDTPPHARANHAAHATHARWRPSASGGKRGSGPWATGPAVPRGKSHSYPPYPAPAPTPPLDYAGLDALCLQMTEQAID